MALANAMKFIKQRYKVGNKFLVLSDNLPLVLELQKKSTDDITINNINKLLVETDSVIYWINSNINISDEASRNILSA